MKTRTQIHAQKIYDQVSTVPEGLTKRYGALCHRFPVMVLRNGLAQAVGFLTAKAKGDFTGTADGLLLAHVAARLNNNATPFAFQSTVHTAELPEYRRLTRDALAASLWYKRYAESVLGIDSAAPGDNS